MRTLSFVKGMATGIILGATAIMVYDPISDRQRHKIMKKAECMCRNLGGMVDTALNAFS